MLLTRALLFLLSKKLVGGVILISALTLALPKQPEKVVDKIEDKYEISPGKLNLFEGVNNYIEVKGWDGMKYLVTLELNYRENNSGSCVPSSIQFLMVKKFNGLVYRVSFLNIINSRDVKLKYTCQAMNDTTGKGNILITFNREIVNKMDSGAKVQGTDHLDIEGVYSEKWKAYVDSSYSRLSDTTLLLKFRLVKA